MIRKLSKLLVGFCFIVGGGIVANAQIGSDVTIRGNVPFDFIVGDTTLPAGKYEVRTPDSTAPNILEVRSVKGRTVVFFDTENMEAKDERPQAKSEFVFDKVGQDYFLSQVWLAGSTSGNEVVKSRMERRLEEGGLPSERHSVFGFMRHIAHHG